MADIIEMILTVVLDGAIDAAGAKRLPLTVRIIIVAIIAVFVLGVCGLLLVTGINTKSAVLILLALIVFISFAFILISGMKQHKVK